MKLALKRVAAYLCDYGVILVCMALLFTAANLGGLGLEGPEPTTALQRWALQGQSFLILTLPVWLYFTLTEMSAKHATLGKQLLKLQVVGSKKQIALRNLLKFAPWELAHTGIWHGMPQPLASEPTALGWVLLISSQGLAAIWIISVFLGGDRSLYDRFAGTQVQAAPQEVKPRMNRH